ncbi:transcription factor BTF3-like [Mesocricetus auratus]|uniref:Transcription factor BTF3-like n=1 Tax=Mesocricetus auratus TaxID=10036 RepID=A0ABM2XEF6_MESAU|nr:transcription factor BTF3-like [Mesocricetus auratus]
MLRDSGLEEQRSTDLEFTASQVIINAIKCFLKISNDRQNSCGSAGNRVGQGPFKREYSECALYWFTNQGTVIHFNHPKIQASLAANTFTITGHAETKQLTEMLPSILNQLGADSPTSLWRLAEALPKQSVDGKAPLATGEEDDDEVPDLVENFDEASKNEAN